MKIWSRCCLVALVVLASIRQTGAQGTGFVYEGRLNDGGSPADGSYDITFALFDGVSGTGQVGGTVTNLATPVGDGLFTVVLDFGAAFSGADRWLEIGVQTNGGSGFTIIAPRQQLRPTPYAIFANTASNVLGTVPSASFAGAYDNEVTLDNAANNISGIFTGDGAGVANVDAALLDGLTSASFWNLGGNAGANPTNGAFVGTTDNLPLEFRVNDVRALRLEYAFDPNPTRTGVGGIAPNVIAGFSGNIVSNGVAGALIAGGGNVFFSNYVAGNYAAILGGEANVASAPLAVTVGSFNSASGIASLAMGSSALASGIMSTAMGWETTASGTRSTAIGDETTASGDSSTALGFETVASSPLSTAMGANTTAAGLESTAMGAFTTTYGIDSIAMGFHTFAEGNYTMAAGSYSDAYYDGSFVWADHSSTDVFQDEKTNQFLIRASGGVGIGTSKTPPGGLNVASGGLAVTGTSSPNYAGAAGVFIERESTTFLGLQIPASGDIYAYNYNGIGGGGPMPLLLNSPGGNVGIGTSAPGALLQVGSATCNGTTWQNASDRALKEHFNPVSPLAMLDKVVALPITEWDYRQDAGTKHVGPMAQDFHAAFGLNGADDKHIATVDEGGVALAAIQGLNQKLDEKDAEIENLKRQNDSLATRLNELESSVKQLAAAK